MKTAFRILALLLMAMLLLSGVVAYADTDNDTKDPVNPMTVIGTDKVVVNNWALVGSSYRVQLVVEFTNVSDEIIPDFEAQIVFYDADGNIIEMEKDGHDVVLPGSTVVTEKGVYNDAILQYDTVEVMVDTEKYTNRYVNHADKLTIKDNTSGNKVFLQVTNNDSEEIEEIEIVVVYYDKDNKIIGASEEEIHDLSAGKKTIMEFSGYDENATDHYVYYVNQAHTF